MTVGALRTALNAVSFSNSNEVRLDSGGYLGAACGVMLEGTQGWAHLAECAEPRSIDEVSDELGKMSVSVGGVNAYRRRHKQELVSTDRLRATIFDSGDPHDDRAPAKRADRSVVGVIRIRSTIYLSTCDETASVADIDAETLIAAAKDRGSDAAGPTWLTPLGAPQLEHVGATARSDPAEALESGFMLVPGSEPALSRAGVQLGADLIGPLADTSPSTRDWLGGQLDDSLLITIDPTDANDLNHVAVPLFLALLNDCEHPGDHRALAGLLAWAILGGPTSWPLPVGAGAS